LEIGEGRGYDEALREGLYAYVGTENLEERWSEGPRIEVEVLRYVREHT
jgi:hypothetical protein